MNYDTKRKYFHFRYLPILQNFCENVAVEFFHHSSWMAMVKNHLKLQLLSFISLHNSKKGKEYTYSETLQKKCAQGYNLSMQGLKSLKPLAIAIENMDPEKQLI
jgi:hypothetical protein